MMKQTVTRKSPFSGKTNSMEMTFAAEDYAKWQIDGVAIQNAMPYLSADEREFLMTGITPEEWEKAFG